MQDLDSRDLFVAGYMLMMEYSLTDKETHEAREKFEGRIRDLALEEETGIPSVVRQFASADASLIGGGE